MVKYSAGAAAYETPEAVMTIEDRRYDHRTEDKVFEEDAKQVIGFLEHLPSGTINEVIAFFLDREAKAYKARGDQYGKESAAEFAKVVEKLKKRKG